MDWTTGCIPLQYVQLPFSEILWLKVEKGLPLFSPVCLQYFQPAFLTCLGICAKVKQWGIKGEGSIPSEPLIHLKLPASYGSTSENGSVREEAQHSNGQGSWIPEGQVQDQLLWQRQDQVRPVNTQITCTKRRGRFKEACDMLTRFPVWGAVQSGLSSMKNLCAHFSESYYHSATYLLVITDSYASKNKPHWLLLAVIEGIFLPQPKTLMSVFVSFNGWINIIWDTLTAFICHAAQLQLGCILNLICTI